jgi:hypothetical protein
MWSKINSDWKTRTNEEIINVFNIPDIVSVIKSKRTEWLGHVQRMEGARSVERIFKDKPGGRRIVGRSRQGWLDGAESDLRTVKVGRWRSIAKGREAWRRTVRDARALMNRRATDNDY